MDVDNCGGSHGLPLNLAYNLDRSTGKCSFFLEAANRPIRANGKDGCFTEYRKLHER